MAGSTRKAHPGRRGRTLKVGPRVYLRRPGPSDYEQYFALMRGSRRLHRGVVNPLKGREDYDRMLQRGRRANTEQHLVCRLDDDAIVGLINLNDIVRSSTQSTYVGYMAFEPYAGQGYMTEGLSLVLNRAFGELKLHRVEAGIQPHNERSIALVNRLGFRYEGTARRLIKIGGRWRDHERWAILREEWRGGGKGGQRKGR